jgi:hypothetical protein
MYAQMQTTQAPYLGSISQAAVDTPRLPEVTHQLDALARNVAGLADVVSQIESRLAASILRPEPPQAAEKGANQLRTAMATHTGSLLQEQNDYLVSTRLRLESMLARLEV